MKPDTYLEFHTEKLDVEMPANLYKVGVILFGEQRSAGYARREILIITYLNLGKIKITQMLWPKWRQGSGPKMVSVTAADLAVWLDCERVTRKQKNRILPELRQAIEAEINKLPRA
ncbi:MAG TPA: hypothetical protein VMR75_04120 [Candidatus Saccharimonadales bacterium]|jgi:hypothetical protein|nr:hypothetical protein [Candidatus Saccharimonadales bacterium]